jgi:capsular polysaccharide biosynthesis protein
MSSFFADPYEMDYAPSSNWSPYEKGGIIISLIIAILFIIGIIDDRDHQIESLKDTLRDKKDLIQHLDSTIERLDDTIADLRHELEAPTPRDKVLRRKLKRAMRRINQMNEMNATITGFLVAAFVVAVMISLSIVTRSEPTCYVPPGY